MFEIIRVKEKAIPTVLLVSAANATEASESGVSEFMMQKGILKEKADCIAHLKESVRVLDNYYPHSYFPSKMGLVFHTPVELTDAVDFFQPSLNDGLEVFKFCAIQNTHVRDTNGEFSFTILISECHGVMPALYYGVDYDSEPNLIASLSALGASIMTKVAERFGNDFDVVRSELIKSNLRTVEAFMKEFVDSESNYAYSLAAQILMSYYHINSHSSDMRGMVSGLSFR